MSTRLGRLDRTSGVSPIPGLAVPYLSAFFARHILNNSSIISQIKRNSVLAIQQGRCSLFFKNRNALSFGKIQNRLYLRYRWQ